MSDGLREMAARRVRERELVLLGVMLADKSRRTLTAADWPTLGFAYEDLTKDGSPDCSRLVDAMRELGVEWTKGDGSPIGLLKEHVLADGRIQRAIGSAARMADYAAAGQMLDLADKRRTEAELRQWWLEGRSFFEACDGRSPPPRKPKGNRREPQDPSQADALPAPHGGTGREGEGVAATEPEAAAGDERQDPTEA